MSNKNLIETPPHVDGEDPKEDSSKIVNKEIHSSVHHHAEKHKNKKEDNRLQTLKKRKLRAIIINIISIAICLVGIYFVVHLFWRNYQYETTNDAMIDQYITPITTRVAGYVKTVRFKEHQFVKKNDTLVELDNIEYKLKVDEAKAALLDAEASLQVLKETIKTSQTNVNVMDANIAESKAKLDILQTDYNRYKNLSEQGSIPQQQFDKASAEYQSMKAHYYAMQRQKDMAISQTNEMVQKINNAEANILRKKAELEMAKLNFSYTIIVASSNGLLGRRNLEAGQFVQAGQVLTNLVNEEGKWVVANYKESQISNIYIGQLVRIKVDGFPNKIFEGRVTTISGATGSKYSLIPTDNSAGNFVKIQQRVPVHIEFENMNSEDLQNLRAGMMVETEAVLKK